MNKIFFSKKHELTQNRYVIPFSCYDLIGIDTEVSPRDRTEREQKVIHDVRERITLALQKHGFELEGVNFRSMAITAIKRV